MDATCAIQASIHVFSLVRKYVSRILGTYQSGMVGYSEPNYFTWTFKKMEGMSPLKFRYEQAEGIREENDGE